MSYRRYHYYDLDDDDEDFYDYYTSPRRTYTYQSPSVTYTRPSYYSTDITLTPTYSRLNGKTGLSYTSPVPSRYNYGYKIPSVAFERVSRVSEPFYSTTSSIYPRMTNMEKYAQSIRPSSPYLDEYLYSPRVDSIFDQLHDMKMQTSAVLAKYSRKPRYTPKVADSTYYSRDYMLSPIDYDVVSPMRKSRRVIERQSLHDRPVTHYRIDDVSRDYRASPIPSSYEPSNYSAKSIGSGHLAAVRYAGEKAHSRRRTPAISDDDRVNVNIKNLSYYIHKKRAAGADDKIPGITNLRRNLSHTNHRNFSA